MLSAALVLVTFFFAPMRTTCAGSFANAFAFAPLHTGCATEQLRYLTGGVGCSAVSMLFGHLRLFVLTGENAVIVSVAFGVDVYASLRFANSGYGTNSHGTLS